MDALVNAGLAIIIFGAGYFLCGLIYFWITTLIRNHRMRQHNRRIMEALRNRFYSGM